MENEKDEESARTVSDLLSALQDAMGRQTEIEIREAEVSADGDRAWDEIMSLRIGILRMSGMLRQVDWRIFVVGTGVNVYLNLRHDRDGSGSYRQLLVDVRNLFETDDSLEIPIVRESSGEEVRLIRQDLDISIRLPIRLAPGFLSDWGITARLSGDLSQTIGRCRAEMSSLREIWRMGRAPAGRGRGIPGPGGGGTSPPGGMQGGPGDDGYHQRIMSEARRLADDEPLTPLHFFKAKMNVAHGTGSLQPSGIQSSHHVGT
jgi:hypothetical protein